MFCFDGFDTQSSGTKFQKAAMGDAESHFSASVANPKNRLQGTMVDDSKNLSIVRGSYKSLPVRSDSYKSTLPLNKALD